MKGHENINPCRLYCGGDGLITEKENRGSPDKKEVCRNDEDLQDPALRHCSFRWLLFKRRVAERSKNSIQSNASRNTDDSHSVLW